MVIEEIEKEVFDLLKHRRVREAFDVLKAIGKRKRRKYNLGESDLAALYLRVAEITFDLEKEIRSIIFEHVGTGDDLYQVKGVIVYEGDEAVEVGYGNYYLVDIVGKSLSKAEELAKEGEDTQLLEQIQELTKRLRQYLK